MIEGFERLPEKPFASEIEVEPGFGPEGVTEREPIGVEVVTIFTCSDKGQPMVEHDSISVYAGSPEARGGLENDRYYKGKGAYTNSPKNPIPRDISFIAEEVIQGTDFSPEQTRRNVITRGVVDYSVYYGRAFQAGTTILFGLGPCDPCVRPSVLSGIGGFKEAFEENGGMRAIILKDGEIVKGDRITFIDERSAII